MTVETIRETSLEGFQRIHQGKVRDVYAVGDDRLLIVATDRLSAFDRVLASGIPGKGAVLTQTSNFWFETLQDVMPNHLVTHKASEMPDDAAAAARSVPGRAVLANKVEIVPVECIVRGYLAGSVQKKYERDGAIQGIKLPPGIQLGGKLPEPIFTPTTKAASGHDQPMTFDELIEEIGPGLADRLRATALAIFTAAAARCADKGLILCDTKFEFGHLPSGELVLADEVLTPDSSRFFKASEHQPGRQPVPWDKQLVRDYLQTLPEGAMEAPEAPSLPAEIIEETSARYREVYSLLAGRTLEEAIAEATA